LAVEKVVANREKFKTVSVTEHTPVDQFREKDALLQRAHPWLVVDWSL